MLDNSVSKISTKTVSMHKQDLSAHSKHPSINVQRLWGLGHRQLGIATVPPLQTQTQLKLLNKGCIHATAAKFESFCLLSPAGNTTEHKKRGGGGVPLLNQSTLAKLDFKCNTSMSSRSSFFLRRMFDSSSLSSTERSSGTKDEHTNNRHQSWTPHSRASHRIQYVYVTTY